MAEPRVSCVVIGCRRTARRETEWDEIICRKCWSLVPARLRRLKNRIYARYRRRPDDKHYRAALRIWDRCVAAANAEVVGIGAR